MRAAVIRGYGGPDAVAVEDISDPVAPPPGHVVVRVRAAALNHLDLWTVGGDLKIRHSWPHVLGADGAGDVVDAGDGVRGIPTGTRVLINPGLHCGRCERCRAGSQSECVKFQMIGEHVAGTFAELVVVPEPNVFPIPQHLSYEEAAALGVTFITAYRMLFTRARLVPGEWVLVTGIGGGLALSLFQLARVIAGRVFVTSSSDEKLRRAETLGADAGINYSRNDVALEVRRLTGKRGVDVVADSAGGPSLDAGLRSLRKGGRLVIAGATAGAHPAIDLRRLFWNQLSVLGSTMGSNNDVADMLRMVAGTKLRPFVDRTVSLEDVPAALRVLADGSQFGKLVVRVD